MQTRAQAAKAAKQTVPVKVAEVEGLDVTLEKLRELQQADLSLTRCFEAAKEGYPVEKGAVRFRVSKETLKRYFQQGNVECSQVCVPKTLRGPLMRFAHDTPMSGHLGAKKTKERIWAMFYWPRMSRDIWRFCVSCNRCRKVSPQGRELSSMLKKDVLAATPSKCTSCHWQLQGLGHEIKGGEI